MSLSNRDRAEMAVAYGILHGKTHDQIVDMLDTDGLLMTDPQVVRTVAELEALDPDTVVWPARHYGPYTVGTLVPDPFNPHWTPPLPAVVIREGAEVRAAQEALGGSDAAC